MIAASIPLRKSYFRKMSFVLERSAISSRNSTKCLSNCSSNELNICINKSFQNPLLRYTYGMRCNSLQVDLRKFRTSVSRSICPVSFKINNNLHARNPYLSGILFCRSTILISPFKIDSDE